MLFLQPVKSNPNQHFMKQLLFIAIISLSSFAAFSAGVLKLKIDTINAANGSVAGVNVRVWNFTNILSIQGTIGFDTTVITYNSVNQFGLSGMTNASFGTANTGSGKLTYSWNDATLGGVTLPDSTIIFTVHFNVTGSAGHQSPVNFVNSPTSLEVIDANFNSLTPIYINGAVIVNSPSGIDEPITNRFNIYPNPAHNQFTLAGQLTIDNCQLSILLYDAFGQLVYEEQPGNVSGFISKTINTSSLAVGIYYLQIRSGGEIISRKVVVEK